MKQRLESATPFASPPHEGSEGAELKISFAGRTDVGRRRSRNEDRLLVDGPHRVAAVADGMGGHPDGDVASDIAIRAIREFCVDADRDATIPMGLIRGSEEERLVRLATLLANRRVLRAAGTRTRRERMGTTLVLAHFSPDCRRVAIANVGDSRCYRIRDDFIRRLTRDHVLTREPGDVGRRNVLTRAVGMGESLEVDVTTDEARPGDVYLLCSDGLWARFEDDEMRAIVAASTTLDDASRTLVDAANERGGFDNITAVLAGVSGAAPPPRRSEIVPRSERGPELGWDDGDRHS